MHCSSSKYIIFASLLIIVVLRWGNVEGATRWQPSIIWDRFNPLLKCKCNWMEMAELQSYDRVELVCPTPYLVSEYRLRDVSRALVYYKIYMRILNNTTHTMEQLQESLNNGSFCDPEHKETRVLHYCKQNPNKDDERFFKLRFNSLNEGDIAVVFSNTKTGSSSDVNTTTKHCHMAFVVNVTDSGERYDISYGKCLKPQSGACSKMENPCLCDNPKTEMLKPTTETTPKPTTKTTTKTTPESTRTLEPRPTPTTKPVSKTTIPQQNATTGSKSERKETSDDSSVWKISFGVVLALALIEPFILAIWIKKKGKKMSRKNQTPSKELSKESKSDTAGNVTLTKNQTPPKELPKETKSDTVGHPNQACESSPTASPCEAGKGNVTLTKNQTPPKELPKETKSDTVGYPNQACESSLTASPCEAGKGNVTLTKNQTPLKELLKELPKETKSDTVGYPNQAYVSSPTAPPFEAGKGTNGRLPSVETCVPISEETEHTYDNVKKPVCESGAEE